jgi:putative transposase
MATRILEPFKSGISGMINGALGRSCREKSNDTEQQIAFALKQAELVTPVEEVCRKMGISDATFYNWRKKFGGLGPSEVRRLKQLEEENAKLKRLVADLSLDKAMLHDVLATKVENLLANACWPTI